VKLYPINLASQLHNTAAGDEMKAKLETASTQLKLEDRGKVRMCFPGFKVQSSRLMIVRGDGSAHPISTGEGDLIKV